MHLVLREQRRAPPRPASAANQINVTYRITSDSESFQQTLASLGGANIIDTTADIERTISALATYFDNHFQFYGRKLNIEFFNGQGSITNELLGSGQQQADADAVTAAQQLHAFAELNGVTEPYDVALSAQHVVNFGVPYLSASFMGQYAPYMWSLDTESNDVVSGDQRALPQVAGRRATPRTPAAACRASRARWRSSPRATPGTRRRRRRAVQEAAAAGHPIADNIQYQLNLSTLSSQASNVISQLQNDGITTVFCGCDPVFPVYLTSRAAEQGYTPEWVVAGVALTDQDIVGQLFQQSEWSHAFGVSFNGPTVPKQQHVRLRRLQAGRARAPSRRTRSTSSTRRCTRWPSGSRWPGPNLTPQTFENGMRAYPGSQAGAPNALYGTWGFPAGHYTPQDGLDLHLLEPHQDVALQRQDRRLRRSPRPGRRSARTPAARCRCRPASRSRAPGGPRATGRVAADAPRRARALDSAGPRLATWAAHARAAARRRAHRGGGADPAVRRARRSGRTPRRGARSSTGAEFGAVNGLLALGLVLTYRASRVINFSYGAMGALAATIGVELNLAHHVQLVRLHRHRPRGAAPPSASSSTSSSAGASSPRRG